MAYSLALRFPDDTSGSLSIRARAMERGQLFYDGEPCRLGHTGQRYTSTGHCVACRRESASGRLRHVVSRAGRQARQRGARYFIGPSCAVCGSRKRYARGRGQCVQCARTRARRTRARRIVSPMKRPRDCFKPETAAAPDEGKSAPKPFGLLTIATENFSGR